jgi:hypothetical protein
MIEAALVLLILSSVCWLTAMRLADYQPRRRRDSL